MVCIFSSALVYHVVLSLGALFKGAKQAHKNMQMKLAS
jgi:hypothetical protein